MENIQLHVADGTKEIVLREGQARKTYDNYKGFSYKADSTQSFIDVVKSRMNPNSGSIIAYNEDGMQAIMDDTVRDREQDTAFYAYKKSIQFKEWEGILRGGVIDQKSFIKFLQRRDDGEVKDLEILLYGLQNFKFVTNIEGDFSQANNNNYTFMYKTKDGEGTVDIPSVINASIEIFNESAFPQSMEIEIEVNKPREAGEKPTFTLQCPKLDRYIKEAMDWEVRKLKEAFSNDLVISGKIF